MTTTGMTFTTLSATDPEGPTPAGPVATFDSLDPATGDVVGTHPIRSEEEVRAAVERAREAASWWAALGADGRKKHLVEWKATLTRRLQQLAHLMHRETGKPHGDALLECALAIDHIAWAASNAGKVLGRQKVSSGMLQFNQAATVEYRPLGVIGVIGPWNYPVFTPMGSIAYALAAGNAVVFKPSEYTPGVGEFLARTFEETVGHPVLQVVTGLGDTGAALCHAGVDKVAFTGSTATGKRVMAACAETLTPVVIEAGGKDALIVDEDADLEAAADATLWGACANAGQTCTGVERVYVHEKVYDDFLDRARRQGRAGARRRGAEPRSARSPCPRSSTSSAATSRTRSTAAAARVVGGVDAVGERYVQPTILVDVPEDSLAVQEETFGPTVTVAKVRDMDEAVARTNATRYGLGSTVFGKARGDGGRRPDPLGHDRGQRRDLLRRHPRAALRRRRRLRLRAHPRPRRPQGVHLRQGHRPPAVQAGDGADLLHPHRRRRGQARPGDDAAPRPQERHPRLTLRCPRTIRLRSDRSFERGDRRRIVGGRA